MAPRTYLVGGGRFELPFRRIILSATTRWSARLDSNQQQPASETSARNPSAGRHAMVETARVELASPGCKPSVLRLNDVPGARRRNRTGHDTLCRRAPHRSACRANWSGSRDSNSHIRSGAPVPNPSARPAQPWYPVLDSNQPVRVRSAESSSRGRGKHFGAGDGIRTRVGGLGSRHATGCTTPAHEISDAIQPECLGGADQIRTGDLLRDKQPGTTRLPYGSARIHVRLAQGTQSGC
jgi:hypothetical protein